MEAVRKASWISRYVRRLGKIFSGMREAPTFPTIIMLLFLVCGIFGSQIAPHDPNKTSFRDSLAPPFWMEGGSTKYLLGTDQLGRDMLSRIIVGTKISLEVGVMVVVFAGLIGATAATVAGYIGGKTDIVIMRLVDMIISFQFLVLAVVLAAILGASKWNIIYILAGVSWAWYARVLRAEVLSLKERDFIKLAIVAGASKMRIIVLHIFPNIVNSLVVIATLNLGTVIIAEASLSFLGLGVPPPDPAWGSMVNEGRNYIGQAWWLCTWPGIAICLVVISFNLMGDWLRVRLDPRFRQTR